MKREFCAWIAVQHGDNSESKESLEIEKKFR
jgi:hypothetical protein